MRTPSLQEFKALAKSNRPLALAVCVAQARAECERERVDAYVRPIFDTYGFQCSAHGTSGPVANVGYLYLCEDARIPEFYSACDRAHRAHGFTGPDGHCPALTAEYALVEAQNVLIDAGKKLLAIDNAVMSLAHRKQMLDLLLSACLNEQERRAA